MSSETIQSWSRFFNRSRIQSARKLKVSKPVMRLARDNPAEPLNVISVQYSSREDFSIIIGEKIIADWKDFEGTMGVNFQLNNLIQGRRYFFRASSGNFKGFGSFKSCNPRSIVPSSWRDLNESDSSAKSKSDQKETFEKIFNFIKLSKREDHQEDSSSRRNSKKKTTIKQLFTAASKFQKTLKRGIYLACICFTDDKVLVTNEDVIPVIEIDDTYPNSLNNDFYWLMKISMSWDCVKELKDDMEKNAMTKVQFRCKILNAIYQMQMALGTTDLGRFYYKPLKDSDGTVVLSCILNVKVRKLSLKLKKYFKSFSNFRNKNRRWTSVGFRS